MNPEDNLHQPTNFGSNPFITPPTNRYNNQNHSHSLTIPYTSDSSNQHSEKTILDVMKDSGPNQVKDSPSAQFNIAPNASVDVLPNNFIHNQSSPNFLPFDFNNCPDMSQVKSSPYNQPNITPKTSLGDFENLAMIEHQGLVFTEATDFTQLSTSRASAHNTKARNQKILSEKLRGWKVCYPCVAIHIKKPSKFRALTNILDKPQREALVSKTVQEFLTLFPECNLQYLKVAWKESKMVIDKDELFVVPVLFYLEAAVKKTQAPFRFEVNDGDVEIEAYFVELGTQPVIEFATLYPQNVVTYDYDFTQKCIVERGTNKPADEEEKTEEGMNIEEIATANYDPSYSTLKGQNDFYEEENKKLANESIEWQERYKNKEQENEQLERELKQAQQVQQARQARLAMEEIPFQTQTRIGQNQNRTPLGNITGSLASRTGG